MSLPPLSPPHLGKGEYAHTQFCKYCEEETEVSLCPYDRITLRCDTCSMAYPVEESLPTVASSPRNPNQQERNDASTDRYCHGCEGETRVSHLLPGDAKCSVCFESYNAQEQTRNEISRPLKYKNLDELDDVSNKKDVAKKRRPNTRAMFKRIAVQEDQSEGKRRKNRGVSKSYGQFDQESKALVNRPKTRAVSKRISESVQEDESEEMRLTVDHPFLKQFLSEESIKNRIMESNLLSLIGTEHKNNLEGQCKELESESMEYKIGKNRIISEQLNAVLSLLKDLDPTSINTKSCDLGGLPFLRDSLQHVPPSTASLIRTGLNFVEEFQKENFNTQWFRLEMEHAKCLSSRAILVAKLESLLRDSM